VSKRVAILFLVISAFMLPASMKSSSAISSQSQYVKGEVLIKFKRGAETQQMMLAHSALNASVVKDYSLTGWQRVRLPEGMGVEEALSHYRKLSFVAEAQPNFIYHILVTPNDARFGELYGMAKIQAPTAWDTTTGSSSVIVAVIDTGVFYNHEDLAPNMWHNPGEVPSNGIDDDSNGYVDDVFGIDLPNNDSDPTDDFNHGTHVAGTIGARGNNGAGVAGVNWNVSIMAIKLHDSAGNATAADAIEAFQYVTMMKNRGINIRVTNNSWGGAPEAAGFDQALKDAIDAAGNAGILNVFSAGNNASNNDSLPFYPASYTSPHILSVAASTATDARAGFSNFGATSVDLAAPGQGILSSIIGTASYGFNSGTSMAAPHVSGAAALLAAHNSSLSNLSLKASLMNSVDALSQWTGLVKTGGRLNIARAIASPTVCNFTLSQNSQFFNSTGGSSSVDVTVATNCDWIAASNAPWITVVSGALGSGNGTVNFSVAANPNSASRTGTMTIAGQPYTVTQEGVAGGCSFSISPTGQSFSTTGGSSVVNVTAGAGCNWTAVSNAAFITITGGASGSGNGSVNYSVAANSGSASRSGTMTIAGQTFTVTQSGTSATCVTAITPPSRAFGATGGTNVVNISAPTNCSWSGQATVAWITITANGSGTGSRSLKYQVASNPTSSSRTGEIIIAGRVHTVTQAGSTTPCSYSISPTGQAFGSSGGTGSVGVTAGTGCGWTAVSNAAFITVTGGASGSGNGTVNYSVTANAATTPRTGTITIAGQIFTVTQSGATGGCSFSINPTSQSFSSSGGAATANVTAGAGCNWTAISNAAFITITSASSGSGPGSVTFSVAANPSTSSRSGTLTIAEQTFTVTQSGASQCSYTVSPTNAGFKKAGGNGNVNVITGAGCGWTAVSNVPWITVTSAGSGSGNAVVNYSVSVNNTGTTRTGTLTVAGKTVTIKQSF
jgi:subtilisin family serine protease